MIASRRVLFATLSLLGVACSGGPISDFPFVGSNGNEHSTPNSGPRSGSQSPNAGEFGPLAPWTGGTSDAPDAGVSRPEINERDAGQSHGDGGLSKPNEPRADDAGLGAAPAENSIQGQDADLPAIRVEVSWDL